MKLISVQRGVDRAVFLIDQPLENDPRELGFKLIRGSSGVFSSIVK